MVQRRGARRWQAQGGQASVELALLLPVVVFLLLAVLQVGLLARDLVLVTHASREAARAAATDPDPTAAEAAAGESSGLIEDRLRRSEEHTSELQSLMRNSYAVFCLKNKNISTNKTCTKKQ